jgi:hypothetical protein
MSRDAHPGLADSGARAPKHAVWDHDDMTVQHSDQPRRLTADDYLAAAPDAFGDIEVSGGLVITSMAQSELHDLVIRRPLPLTVTFEDLQRP